MSKSKRGFFNPKFQFKGKRLSKKDKDKQRKAMFANMNKGRTSRKRRRPKIEFHNPKDKVKYTRSFKNDVHTLSNSNDVRVVDSSDDKVDRRNWQTNSINIDLDDKIDSIVILDQQNSLKPKKEKFIITEKNEETGKINIREFDKTKRQVAHLELTTKSQSNLENLSDKETQKLVSSVPSSKTIQAEIKFKKWHADKFSEKSPYKMKTRNELVPLASKLGLSTGSPTTSKMKRRLKKELIG